MAEGCILGTEVVAMVVRSVGKKYRRPGEHADAGEQAGGKRAATIRGLDKTY